MKRFSVAEKFYLLAGCLILLLFSFEPQTLLAQTALDFYNLGNKFFSEKEYDSAVVYYEKAVEMGANDADLFYNLGNAYFKSRKLGRAILNYRRALLISPRSKEIKYNLAFSRAFLRDDIKPVYSGFIYNVYSFVINFFSFRELLYIILLCSLFVTLFGVALILKGRKIARKGLFMFSVLLVVFCSIYAMKFRDPWQRKLAVVVVPELQVRSGPDSSAELLFSIHEGTIVVTSEEREGWVRIKIQDGKEGWGNIESVEQVIPAKRKR